MELGTINWKNFLHRLAHRIGSNPCDLLEVIHEPDCPGFCGIGIMRGSTSKVCNVKLKLRCRVCGVVETT